MEIKNTKTLKEYNKMAVLSEIINRQPISRSQLSKYLNVSHTTVSNLINELKKQKLIVEKRSDSTGGRPPKLLSFNGDNKFTISLILKERVIIVGLFNLNSRLIEKNIIKVKQNSFEIIINDIKEVVNKLLDQHNIKKSSLNGIGFSIPGSYQETNDKILNKSIKYLPTVYIKNKLEDVFDFTEIYIENHANIEAFYEWNDKFLREYNNLLYIRAGDSIGSGLIIDNKLYRGSFNKAGSLEHFIVDPNGRKCTCGKKGCLITTSSIKAIEDEFNEALWKGENTKIESMFESPFNYKKIIKAYLKDDSLSKKIIDNSLKYFSIALANIIKLIDPEIIILGGLFDEFDETMINEVNRKVKTNIPFGSNSFPAIVKRKKEKNYQLKAINSYVFHKIKTKI